MPFFNPQSLMLPRSVNVKPTVAWGNQSLKVSMLVAFVEIEHVII